MLPRMFVWKISFLSVTTVSLLITVHVMLYNKPYTKFRERTSLMHKIQNLAQVTKITKNTSTKPIFDKNNYRCQSNSNKFKFYIYDLPQKFNKGLVTAMQNSKMHKHCFQLDNYGMGPELFRSGVEKQLVVRNTHQFSLEVIIHNKLLWSPYRTYNPEEADIFYIPAYIGLACILYHGNQPKINHLIQQLFTLLRNFSSFKANRPHFTTIGKIQREMALDNCPYLMYRDVANITFITIEKEQSTNWLKYKKLWNLSLITTPYPSYIHFMNNEDINKSVTSATSIRDRNVFIFLAAGSRRTNRYRANIMNQIPIVTRKSYYTFYNSSTNDMKMVKLQTDECDPNHKWTTIPWMQHSIFCLQPPGDSPTRKSFYDAILSGCIPVLFPYPNEKNPYPFQSRFNYSQFTVTIPYDTVAIRHANIFHILKNISITEIDAKLNKLKEVAACFQYSELSDNMLSHNDAIQVILDNIADIYQFSPKNS